MSDDWHSAYQQERIRYQQMKDKYESLYEFVLMLDPSIIDAWDNKSNEPTK